MHSKLDIASVFVFGVVVGLLLAWVLAAVAERGY